MSLSKPSLSSGLEPAGSKRSELPPLSAADFHSANFLSNVLGLPPSSFSCHERSSDPAQMLRTLQSGDLKYSEMGSPLNRVCCPNRYSRNEFAPDVPDISLPRSHFSCGIASQQGDMVGPSAISPPDSGLFNKRNGFGDEGQLIDHLFSLDQTRESPCRNPPGSVTPPSGSLGFGSGDGAHLTKPSESRGLSPQSDIGYGTSFESNDSRCHSLRRDIDIEGLSELIRNVSMNTFSMKIPGSPLSSSIHGGNHFGKSCCGDNLNVLQASGLSQFNPTVAQAALQTIHHHHSHTQKRDQTFLQSLDQCFNSGGSSGGLFGEVNRLDSYLDQSHDDQFLKHSLFNSSVSSPFLARGLGIGISSQQHLDILDIAARNHRSSAGSIIVGGPGRARYAVCGFKEENEEGFISEAISSATLNWSGKLPLRGDVYSSQLSCKVFLGGVAWDITEQTLASQLKIFGNVRVDWPSRGVTAAPKGYLYVIFENEAQVRSLLTACTHDFGSGGSWYYQLFSVRKSRAKDIQVIPWVISDSRISTSHQIDPKKTVFVGALHGTMTAEGLCHIFNDLFGGVVFASIDTDKYKYPIGSGRVSFCDTKSYMNALAAAFIEIRTPKFTKKIQVDPYLEDALCSSCNIRQGPYFCREFSCFKYFCHTCWESNHSTKSLCHHKTLMRNPRPNVPTTRNRSPTSSSPGLPAACMGMSNHFDE